MNQDSKKKNAAEAAFSLIKPKLNKDTVLGIGTGSTTNFFTLFDLRNLIETGRMMKTMSFVRLRQV